MWPAVRACWKFFAACAETITSSFNGVELTLLLQAKSTRQLCIATTVWEAAIAGEAIVPLWNESGGCNLQELNDFLPDLYFHAYIGHDWEAEDRRADPAVIEEIKHMIEATGRFCSIGEREDTAEERQRLIRLSAKYLVLLTRQYLKLIEDDESFAAKELALFRRSGVWRLLVVALEPEVLDKATWSDKARLALDTVRNPLDFTTRKKREDVSEKLEDGLIVRFNLGSIG